MRDGSQDWNPEDDPVVAILLSGEATTLHQAEEMYLNRSLPVFLELLGSPLSNEDLSEHPLTKMLVRHGSRPREDWVS